MKAKKSIVALCLSAVLTLSAISFSSFSAIAAGSVLLQGAGYETIYVEWNGASGTDYNVYCKESAQEDSAYKKVDSELVRNVKGNAYRVDVLGLKGGTSYDVKVVPVSGGTEGAPITTYTATPEAYDRSGFAFAKNSAPGAYNADGTVADGTLIIYATEQNKKNVYNNKSLTSLLGGLNSLNKGKPIIIRVIGKITPVGSSTSPGMWKNTCGVTIEGVGPESGFSGWGIGSGDNKDTEFRNMNFVDYTEDAIGFENAEDLWVHNNTFYSGWYPKDSTSERDKLHGDGSCDLRECNNVTVSYNHFSNTDKTSLIGSSSTSRESTGNITFHHNFFEGTSQRTPRVRWHNIHVYNNYYYGTTAYGIGATCNCSIFAENNYFEDASSPFLTSSQGGFASKFSDNEGGVIKAYNNIMVNTRESLEGVDYFNAPSREYRMTGADFTAKKGGWTYNNFDANGYIGSKSYILHSPQEAKTIALTKSGAQTETAIPTEGIAPPKVTGNVTAVYYYDPETSGSTGKEFGGLDGTGSFFKIASAASCKANNASGYRGTEKYDYSGSFSTGSEISFTTSSAAKFTVIASTSGNTPQRVEVKCPENTSNVYHGIFQTGNKGNDVITTIDLLDAGTYTFKPSTNVDIYYVEVAEYDGEIPETTTSATTQSTTVVTTETSTQTTTVETSTQATTIETSTQATTVETSTQATTVETSTQATTVETSTQATTEEPVTPPEPFTPIYGNANGNGSIEIEDVVSLFNNVLTGAKMGIEDKLSDFMKYVDVDGNGRLDSADVAHVLQKVLDNSYEMPVER